MNVIKDFTNRLLLGDCYEAMRMLPTGCIPLTVTSPPYDGIRTYGGHGWDFFAIAEELYRITSQGGIVVWIVQEQVVNGAQTGSTSDQRIWFKETGFTLHDVMIMVSRGHRLPQRNRYVNQYQYAFILCKGKPRHVNKICDKPNNRAGEIAKGGVRTLDGRLVYKWRNTRIAPYGCRSNVWNYPVGYGHTTKDTFAFEHPALMPEAMAEDHIISWSRPYDLVFDPFMGAGTTPKMAVLNHRRFLGVEIHDLYFDIAVKRVRLALDERDRIA